MCRGRSRLPRRDGDYLNLCTSGSMQEFAERLLVNFPGGLGRRSEAGARLGLLLFLPDPDADNLWDCRCGPLGISNPDMVRLPSSVRLLSSAERVAQYDIPS